MRHLRWFIAPTLLAAALILGGLEAISLHVGLARLGRPVSWTRAALGTVPSWLLVALLAWPIRVLTRHARIGPATWLRALPLHLLGTVLFVLASVLGVAFINSSLGLLNGEPLMAAAWRYFLTYLAYMVLTYWALAGAFHWADWQRESETRERERLRMATSLTEAKLDALRAQLSPHFFFNTLNAISTFSAQGKPEQVGEMVGALGELVRASLDPHLGHEIPLARELELLDLYLDIQRVRFADWLRIDRCIAPETLAVPVPSLMLQPLVENAIEHGTPDEDGIVHVTLRCHLAGDMLVLEVENPDRSDAPLPATGPHAGVGLGNTKARLEQLHPGQHHLVFGDVPGRGFMVSARIPANVVPGVTGIGGGAA
jgi:two-component system, LytTR family, sensor kinase